MGASWQGTERRQVERRTVDLIDGRSAGRVRRELLELGKDLEAWGEPGFARRVRGIADGITSRRPLRGRHGQREA